MKRTLKNIAILTMCYLVCASIMQKPVYAYVDPAASAYLLQILAGIVIAAGVSVGVFWKKIKLFFKESRLKRIEKSLERKSQEQ